MLRQLRVRLRAFWLLLDGVPWTCEYCRRAQETPKLIWPSLRYQLICTDCENMQNYPAYIRKIDPLRRKDQR